MISTPKSGDLITRALSSGFDAAHAGGFAPRGSDARRTQPSGSYAPATVNRVDRSLTVSAEGRPRILLADAAFTLHELHLVLLRSISAIVETLASCTDLYFHEGRVYALIILVLHPQSKETAEAAHFVRHRWSAARILLLGSESAAIDDWLYDDRVDLHSHPSMVCDAAIRLMTEGKVWTPA
jgi:hypothetical protein